ncbi:endonuclease [[Empedobacter] haloabium]|uniref:Endonuclease n=1 Tax=[Empedobacter] haloabium TaxID=592317 RepID=A0ABZ1USD9_9BURK
MMDFTHIAVAAGERWQRRAEVREPNLEKIRNGKAIEAESPQRVQARLARLSQAAVIPAVRPPALMAPLTEAIGLERIQGNPDFLDMNFVELALAVARFVGRINIRSKLGRSIGYGTGFMVSPTLLLTNHHVLESADVAAASEVEFDYQNDRAGRQLPIVGFKLEPQRFFMTNAALDFTLVAVAAQSARGIALNRYGWSRLIGTEGKVLLGEPLNIIQHPRGEAKQLVLRSNELVDLFDDFAHYVTDTEPGSSGSPVYNDQWEVVALHHAGVPSRDAEGRLLTRDGRVWEDGMDPDLIGWVANEGIRVSSLVNYIQAQPLPPAQAALRDDLLNLTPPSALEAAAAGQAGDAALAHAAATAAAGAASVPTAPVAPGHAAVAQAGTASWTIPLTVTVQLGQPVQQGALAPPGALPAIAPLIAPAGAPSIVVPPARPALAEALAELARAPQRAYYDAAADGAARDAYYAQFALPAEPAAAHAALHELLTRTHTTQPAYRPAKHLYPWVELRHTRGGDDIVSIYSGKGFSARDLIENDFAIDEQRSRLRAAVALPRPGALEAAPVDEDFLEAALPYNCEHVVPQSWFDKREPMRGDLHHLFACEMDCNSFRGNTPFFDFADFGEIIRTDCGKREPGKFEPGSGKGPVARATLYFLLRYPGLIDRSASEYSPERIATLLAWHDADPVTDYERHRNAAIFEKQGNRNPLIDFPDWAARIDFVRGLAA